MEKLVNIFKMLKVNHYVKNLIIFVPLLFSLKFLQLNYIISSIYIFISFCLISSSVYIMNDLIDINEDKLHPVKKRKVIAQGLISKKVAIFVMMFLLISGIIISNKINIFCPIILLSYVILNICYSVKLKNIFLVDVTCIALGFILRIIAGCACIYSKPSALVILLTFFASMFFSFMKRKLELTLADNVCIRESLKGVTIETINQFILINAILAVSFYITYVLDSNTINKVGSEFLYITVIPFVYVVYRLLFLINNTNYANDPIHFIEQDKSIKIAFILYLVIFIIIYYL